MTPGITRREFLKMGAVASTALVISGCTLNLQKAEYLESFVQPPEEALPGEALWYASTCRQCSAACGIIVRVSNGRARKIEGNPLHPVNRGKLCARGQAALQELYDPDRLRHAVRQSGGRGSQIFTPVTWEEALNTLSEKLQAAGPEAVACLGGNLPTHLAGLTTTFFNAWGGRPPVFYRLSDEVDGRTRLSRLTGELFGTAGVPYFDLGNADVVFSFGANFLETWLSPVAYSRAYSQLRRGALGKRGYLVQFEPRMSSTAACADEWIAVHPGTEGLVALALGKLLTERGAGRTEFAATFAAVDVEAAARLSGVSVETLERLAGILATVPRPLALPGASTQQSALALNGLLGRLGEPGGLYLPAMPPPGLEVGLQPMAFAEVRALIDAMNAGQIKVLLLAGANPLFELPAGAGFATALKNVPLVVSFSSTVDDTVLQSDLTLPDHTSLESWGYALPPVADRPAVSSGQPVVSSLYDTRATADVWLALAQQWGGAVGQALPWPNEVAYLKATVAADDAAWAEWRRHGGWWPEAADLRAPAATAALAAPLQIVAPAVEDDPAEYPYHLCLYPSITLGADGRGANRPWLQEVPDPMTTVAWQTWIEIAPETAAQLDVKDNDIVKVLSRAGEVEAIVYTYHGIREDVVGMPLGRGQQAYGRYAKGNGSHPLALLIPGVEANSGALAWHGTRVRIVPTGRRRTLARLENAEGVEYLRGEE